jgi:hypothetical protein
LIEAYGAREEQDDEATEIFRLHWGGSASGCDGGMDGDESQSADRSVSGRRKAAPKRVLCAHKQGKPDFGLSFNLPNGADIETGVGSTGRDGGKVIIEPADGRLPYTPAARAKADDIAANRMILEPSLHCFPGGVPHQTWMQFGAQYLQNKDYLLIVWEMNHDRRIIPLDGRPHQLPDSVRLFQGESVGHWEGDILVVRTTNQGPKNWFDTAGHFQPADVDVVERFTMTDSNTIRYESTTTSREFTQPMKVAGTISRAETENPSYEHMEWGCIEGNRDLGHYTSDVGGKAENVGGLTR